jgi:hypothetical protein
VFFTIAGGENMKIKDGNKIPDLVVWTEADGFDARLKKYPTNLGAPAFEAPNMQLAKAGAAQKMLSVFERERLEIIEKMKDLYEEYETSMMVWNSKISFEPIVGHTYHLYEFSSGKTLSLISPSEWKKQDCYIGSYTLTSENKWKIVNNF